MAEAVIRVTSAADALASRATVRAFLEGRPFSPDRKVEVAIVVAELAANLWRHAGGGTIRLSDAAGTGATVLLIEATDSGPGLPGRAFEDGFTTKAGLGGGLGAVRRLSDRLEIETREGYTQIRAWKSADSMSE